MQNIGKLAGRVALITGASRGIGKEIALKLARDGAKIVIAAKTTEPHPKLPGTIYTAAEEVKAAGGEALPCVVDVRDEDSVVSCVEKAVKEFGGIDILINNASAISLTGTLQTPMKRYDLMHQINTRGTYMMSQKAIPYLKQSSHAHILNISPPLNMSPKWFENHVAYTMAKYGMSMCVLGMSGELHKDNIAVNALWPRTAIITAAMEMLGGGKEVAAQCRKPEIMADAAYAILCRDPRNFTGKFAIDDEILAEQGIRDFDQYACQPGHPLLPDFFLDEAENPEAVARRMAEGGASPVFRDGKAQADARSVEASGGVEGVFAQLKGHLNPELVGKAKASYAFDVKEEGLWHLDLSKGSGSAGKGPIDAPDCTFSMDAKTFVDMFTGKIKPTAAFMAGKMQIKGDMGKAMKLEQLMASMNAKL